MPLAPRTRLVTLLVAAGLVAAGCSSDSDTTSSDVPKPSGTYPVTVTTETGATTIEEYPERVVTLGNPAFENVTALGIEPAGASVNNIENLPYLAEYADDKAINDSLADVYANEINYEEIVALEPDLIVAPAWPQFTEATAVAKLNQIAPTLIFDMQDANNDWRVGVRQVAQAFGKDAEGERLINEAISRFETVGSNNPALADRPYSFGLYYNSNIMLASGGNILRLLGMKPAADQLAVEDNGAQTVYAEETVGEVKGSLVLLLPSPRESIATLEQSPLWETSLADRVVWISDAQGEAINNAGILGKTWVPQDLDSTLAGLD